MASSGRDRRLAKELSDIQADRTSGVSATMVDGSNMTKLMGTISGPPDSPYGGGTFNLSIEIPSNYPFKPPIMVFKTPIWHPNVSSVTGVICLDTLASAWSPVQTIKTALLSVRMLLEAPNPSDPQDAVVAAMLINEPDRFRKEAHDWSVQHANATLNEKWNKAYQTSLEMGAAHREVEFDDPAKYQGYNKIVVGKFVAMGFGVEQIVEAFKYFELPPTNSYQPRIDEGLVADITARLLGDM